VSIFSSWFCSFPNCYNYDCQGFFVEIFLLYVLLHTKYFLSIFTFSVLLCLFHTLLCLLLCILCLSFFWNIWRRIKFCWIKFCCMYSARYCDVDENGVRHLVLCRVIMGNMEILRPGTGQFQPSSYEYDNGVDDIQCPRYYVVWNMNINTHIYPEFVVSFKLSFDAEGDALFL